MAEDAETRIGLAMRNVYNLREEIGQKDKVEDFAERQPYLERRDPEAEAKGCESGDVALVSSTRPASIRIVCATMAAQEESETYVFDFDVRRLIATILPREEFEGFLLFNERGRQLAQLDTGDSGLVLRTSSVRGGSKPSGVNMWTTTSSTPGRKAGRIGFPSSHLPGFAMSTSPVCNSEDLPVCESEGVPVCDAENVPACSTDAEDCLESRPSAGIESSAHVLKPLARLLPTYNDTSGRLRHQWSGSVHGDLDPHLDRRDVWEDPKRTANIEHPAKDRLQWEVLFFVVLGLMTVIWLWIRFVSTHFGLRLIRLPNPGSELGDLVDEISHAEGGGPLGRRIIILTANQHWTQARSLEMFELVDLARPPKAGETEAAGDEASGAEAEKDGRSPVAVAGLAPALADSELRNTAMTRMAELVDSRRPILIFTGSDSWPGSGRSPTARAGTVCATPSRSSSSCCSASSSSWTRVCSTTYRRCSPPSRPWCRSVWD